MNNNEVFYFQGATVTLKYKPPLRLLVMPEAKFRLDNRVDRL